jgi:hypothetical protein
MLHADAQARQNDLAEYIIQRSITFFTNGDTTFIYTPLGFS